MWLAVLLMGAAALVGLRTTLDDDPLPTVASVQPLIYHDQMACTAFAIHRAARLWMTAAHCVTLSPDAAIDLPDESIRLADAPITPIFVDREMDLAIIRASTGGPAIRLGLPPAAGTPVTVIGYPGGLAGPPVIHQFRGFVSAFGARFPDRDRSYTVFDVTSCYGTSGSPILARAGRHWTVVSVVQIGAGAPCSGYVGGVPTPSLRTLHAYFEIVTTL